MRNSYTCTTYVEHKKYAQDGKNFANAESENGAMIHRQKETALMTHIQTMAKRNGNENAADKDTAEKRV